MKSFPVGSEVVSFNELVPDLSKLLEVDGADLDGVLGGKDAFTALGASCGTYTGSCSSLSNCNTYNPNPNPT